MLHLDEGLTKSILKYLYFCRKFSKNQMLNSKLISLFTVFECLHDKQNEYNYKALVSSAIRMPSPFFRGRMVSFLNVIYT